MDKIFSKLRSDSDPNTQPTCRSEVSFREFDRKKVGPPYYPICNSEIDKYGSKFELRFIRANGKTIAKNNIVTPFAQIFDSNSTCYVSSYIDFMNDTFVDMINDVILKEWPISACKHKLFVVTTDYYEDQKTSTSVFWPASEKYMIIHVPDQELIDYVVYVCSCVGIWFGLSIYSIYDSIITIEGLIGKKVRRQKTST